MSSGHRDDRPALIALALLLLAICLVGLFEGTARHYASQEIAKYETAYPHDGAAQEYSPIISSLREFDPREDTYAQWMMAAFSVVATLASVFAVVLLKDTLAATREAVRAADDAVKVTRELGQAQVRAYLNCTGASYSIVNQLCVITINLRNYGASPTPHAIVTGSMIVPNIHSVSHLDGFLRTGIKTAEIFSVPAGGDAEAILAIQLSFPTKVRQELFDGEWYASADCVLKWTDVFNDTQEVNFFLVESSREFKTDGGFPTRRIGGMKVSNTRPHK